ADDDWDVEACYHLNANHFKPMNLRGQQGYAMAVLLVSLSVMAILLTIAMPVWKHMAQREKETELVFRGQQYVHAIGLYQRKHGPGVLPPNVDALLNDHYPDGAGAGGDPWPARAAAGRSGSAARRSGADHWSRRQSVFALRPRRPRHAAERPARRPRSRPRSRRVTTDCRLPTADYRLLG